MNTRRGLLIGILVVIVIIVVAAVVAYSAGRASINEQQFVCPTAPAPFVSETNLYVTVKGDNQERYLACGWMSADPLAPNQQP
jgi:hypothetical protein